MVLAAGNQDWVTGHRRAHRRCGAAGRARRRVEDVPDAERKLRIGSGSGRRSPNPGIAGLTVSRSPGTALCCRQSAELRLLDDRRGFLGDKPSCFGVVHRMDGTEEPLTLRELTNKIIHAEKRYWDQSRENDPKLICIAPDDQQKQFGWVRAEVSIVNLAVDCPRGHHTSFPPLFFDRCHHRPLQPFRLDQTGTRSPLIRMPR
jgi:hypothetical protein